MSDDPHAKPLGFFTGLAIAALLSLPAWAVIAAVTWWGLHR